jgi:4-amino-4-deoxy-L-arabinose transferase-like glycosyltransferase
MLSEIATNEIHGPLYYITLRGWILLFGRNEIVVRALFSLFTVGILFVFYLLFKEIFPIKRKFQILGLLLMASNATLILHGNDARWYPMLTFLLSLSLISLILYLKTKRRIYIILFLLIATLGLYTDAAIMVIFVSFSLYFILVDKYRNLKTWFWWLSLSSLILILFLPWLTLSIRITLEQLFSNTQRIKFLTNNIFINLAYFFYGLIVGETILPLHYLLVGICISVWAVTLFFAFKRIFKNEKSKVIFLLFLILCVVVLLNIITKSLYARYYLYCIPIIIAIFLYGLEIIPSRLFKIICFSVVFLVNIIGIWNLVLEREYHKMSQADPLEKAFLILKEKTLPHDIIICQNSKSAFYYSHTLDRQWLLIQNPLLAKEKINSAINKINSKQKVVFLVLPSGQLKDLIKMHTEILEVLQKRLKLMDLIKLKYDPFAQYKRKLL